MDRTVFFRLTATAMIAPLALGLAACKKDETGSPAAPVAAVAAPAGKQWKDIVAVTPDGGYLMGNPQAPVKVIEYGSLSCPHCAKFAQEGFPPLVDKYIASGKVSLEFRSFAIHPQDVPLTVLAECAGTDAFFPMVEEVYRNFDAVTERTMKGAEAADKLTGLPDDQRFVALSDTLGFTDFFAGRGLSRDQQKACLSDFSRAQKVAKNSEAYGSHGIESTPTLMVNGTKVNGAEWKDLQAALTAAGAG